MNIGTNATLAERFDYDRVNLSDQEILEALFELERTQELLGDRTIDELVEEFDKLEETQCKNHEDYDELKSFFDDCVASLNSNWPAAEAYDQNLRQVICDAITKGDVEKSDA